MPFNLKQFNKTEYQLRTADVKITTPALMSFFSEGDDPVWKVRGLTAAELALAEESILSKQTVFDVIKEAVKLNNSDKITELGNLLGNTTDLPKAVKKRIEHLVLGSIDPVIDTREAVILQQNFPVEFMELSNKILELTGQGAEIKKSLNSGEPDLSETL
jgi:hypothetical protein